MSSLPQFRNQKKRYHSRQTSGTYRGVPLLRGYEQYNRGRQGIEETYDDEMAYLDYNQRMLRFAQQHERLLLPRHALLGSSSAGDYDEHDIDYDDSEMDFE